MRLTAAAFLLVAAQLAGVEAFAPGVASAPVRIGIAMPRAAPSSYRRAAVPSMGLMDVIKRLLYGEEKREVQAAGAGGKALSRLQVVLASDRTGLDEITMAKIRMEIKGVIAKYVTIDDESVDFSLHADDQLTLVTATFPLKGRPIPVGIGPESDTEDARTDLLREL